MSEYLKELNPSLLIIILFLLSGLLLFLVRFIIKQFDKYLEKIDEKFKKIDKKINLLFIEQDSTDYALDQCLPSNGHGFLDYKKEKKKELKEKVDYVSGRFD